MLSKLLASQSRDDLFIHVDLFVFPPLAEHNKGGGVEFQREPHCTEMAIYSAFHNVCVMIMTREV